MKTINYKNFYRYLLFLIALMFKGIVQSLPRRLVVPLGKGVGLLCYWLLRRERKRALQHLKLVYGNSRDIGAIARGVFENLGMNLVEWLQMVRLNRDKIDKIVACTGIEKVREALAKGKGIIMLTGHFGNWEYLGAYFGLHGYQGAVIGKKIYYHNYNKLLCQLREAVGVETIWRSGSIKKMLSALRKNGLLGILPDQDTKKVDGIFADFLGHISYTPSGPINLALASGAVLLPCFIVREGRGHRIFVEDPIEIIKGQDKDETISINTRKWVQVLEKYINKYPDQWVWIHRKWRTKQNKGKQAVKQERRVSSLFRIPRLVKILKVGRIIISCLFFMAVGFFSFSSSLRAEGQAIAKVAEEVEGFTMTMVDSKGKAKASICGSVANLLPGNLIEISDVVVRIYKSKPGDSDIIVHTSKGTYDRNKNIIDTDQFVRINHMNTVIVGSGLRWEPNKSKLMIKENIRVEYHNDRLPGNSFSISKDSPNIITVITAEGSGKVNYQKNYAVFKNNVKVEDPQAVLKANRMKVFFSGGKQSAITRVEAYGNVEIKQPKRKSFSRKAIYYTADDKVVLSGDPRIVQGLDLYTADRITIYDKGNQVVFEPRAQLLIYSGGEHSLL